MSPFYIAIFVEGGLAHVEPCGSDGEAYAYALGVERGASLHGEEAVAYVLPDEDAEMVAAQKPEEVDAARAAIAKEDA